MKREDATRGCVCPSDGLIAGSVACAVYVMSALSDDGLGLVMHAFICIIYACVCS